jgi:membrane-bound metal-dependent hydrolase YbcI (DUF457 family)
MSSPVGHTLAACCVAAAAARRLPALRSPAVFALAALAGNLPDIDVAPALLLRRPELLRYHQAFTHSLPFALLASLPLALLLARGAGFLPAWGTLAAAAATHPALDLLTVDTTPPIGFPVLWPLSDAIVHAPVSLFLSVIKFPAGRLVSLHNLLAVAVETAWLLPILLLLLRRPRAPGPRERGEGGISRPGRGRDDARAAAGSCPSHEALNSRSTNGTSRPTAPGREGSARTA